MTTRHVYRGIDCLYNVKRIQEMLRKTNRKSPEEVNLNPRDLWIEVHVLISFRNNMDNGKSVNKGMFKELK